MMPSAAKTSTAAKTSGKEMDCLIDTNIVLRSADRRHPASLRARQAMKILFRYGYRLCVAKQTLIESWVVATRPRDANGFGYSAQFATEGIAKIKRLFHLLTETDDIYPTLERLVLSNRVLGKNAYDARLVAAMQVHNIRRILTFDTGDFMRYAGIQVLHPDEVLAHQ
jgi:predicted nucleic acid-binding protein